MLDLGIGNCEPDPGVGSGPSRFAGGIDAVEGKGGGGPRGATSIQRMVGLIGASSLFSKPRVST